MKIKQKHGINKPLYAAGATLLAATTLLGGCDNIIQYNGEEVIMIEESTTESEIMLEGDVIEYTDESVDVSCSDCEFDLDQAGKELDEYCGSFPTSMRMDSSMCPEQNVLLDFTGDGHDDLITGFTYGSGIVRDTIVVYDVINKNFITFYAQMDSYSLIEITDGKLIVQETVYPDKKTMGTVVIEDGYLVFVADEAVDETGESTAETSDETSAEVTDEE